MDARSRLVGLRRLVGLASCYALPVAALASTGVVCYIDAGTVDCCAVSGSFNSGRMCGGLNDQPCPDVAITTASVHRVSQVPSPSGREKNSTAMACTYQPKKCTGIFPPYCTNDGAPVSTSCYDEQASGAKCATPEPSGP